MSNAVQHAAVEFLRELGVARILAWLDVLRSIAPGHHIRFRPGHLTRRQLNVLSTIQIVPTIRYHPGFIMLVKLVKAPIVFSDAGTLANQCM